MSDGVVSFGDKDYPRQLEMVVPKVKRLWYRGSYHNQDWSRLVAVVGSRKMSRYGKQVISRVVPELVSAGYGVVSGLMYGVDQEAHRVTLESGGRAIGVLGYGIDYDSELGAVKMIGQIEQSEGVILSEYEADMPSARWMFPQRNRIVVGLSEMVVIIEAGEKSGSLNTANWAVQMGKRILAVPGSVFSMTSVGTNKLIADGIAEALTQNRLRELVGKSFGGTSKVMGDKVKLTKREMDLRTKLQVLGPSSINELRRSVGWSIGELMSGLSQLEMKGIVEEERGVWQVC